MTATPPDATTAHESSGCVDGAARVSGRQARRPPSYWPAAVVALLAFSAGVTLALFVRTLRADPYPEVRQTIAALSPVERQQLLRLQERFHELPADEQRRLRQLHDALAHDPQEEALRETLRAYHEWVLTLSHTQRAELLKRRDDTAQRLELVRQLQFDHPPHLRSEDRRALVAWLEKHFEPQLPQRAQAWLRAGGRYGSFRLLWTIYNVWSRGPRNDDGLAIRPETEQELLSQLSAEAQRQWRRANTPEEKKLLVAAWAMQIIRRMSRGEIPPLPASREALAEFFEKELKPSEREELLALPTREREQRLIWYYLRAHPPDRGPDDSGPRGPFFPLLDFGRGDGAPGGAPGGGPGGGRAGHGSERPGFGPSGGPPRSGPPSGPSGQRPQGTGGPAPAATSQETEQSPAAGHAPPGGAAGNRPAGGAASGPGGRGRTNFRPPRPSDQ